MWGVPLRNTSKPAIQTTLFLWKLTTSGFVTHSVQEPPPFPPGKCGAIVSRQTKTKDESLKSKVTRRAKLTPQVEKKKKQVPIPWAHVFPFLRRSQNPKNKQKQRVPSKKMPNAASTFGRAWLPMGPGWAPPPGSRHPPGAAAPAAAGCSAELRSLARDRSRGVARDRGRVRAGVLVVQLWDLLLKSVRAIAITRVRCFSTEKLMKRSRERKPKAKQEQKWLPYRGWTGHLEIAPRKMKPCVFGRPC